MKEGASVGIVTSNFHVFRALQIAKSTDFPMSVELRRIPHQNICRTICCGNFCRDEVAVIEKNGEHPAQSRGVPCFHNNKP